MMYIEAHTKPWLSGLQHKQINTRSTDALEQDLQVASGTHIGVSYVFSRSLPFKLARMKVSPNAGTRYKDPTSASKESPNDACKAGRGGAGSSSGRRRNQDAVGTSVYSRAVGRRRGRKAGCCAIALPRSCSVPFRRNTLKIEELVK